MVALPALVSGLDAELVRLGYKDSTMVWYRGCWRRLQKYFAARGAGEFSLDVAMAWVEDACGFSGKEQAGRTCTSHVLASQLRALPKAPLTQRQISAVPSGAATAVPMIATATPDRRTQSGKLVPSAGGTAWTTGGQYSTVPTIVQ